MDKGDVLLLAILSSSTEVAYYTIAKKLAFSILSLTDPFAQAIYPQFANLTANKKYKEITKLIEKIVKIIMPIAILIFIISLSYGEFIIINLFGNDYKTANISFIILMFITLLSSIYFWTLNLLFCFNLVKFRLILMFLAFLVFIVASFSLIPHYGNIGAAVGLCSANLLIIIGSVYKIRNFLMGNRTIEDNSITIK